MARYDYPIFYGVWRKVLRYIVKKQLEECSTMPVWSAGVQQVCDDPVQRNLIQYPPTVYSAMQKAVPSLRRSNASVRSAASRMGTIASKKDARLD